MHTHTHTQCAGQEGPGCCRCKESSIEVLVAAVATSGMSTERNQPEVRSSTPSGTTGSTSAASGTSNSRSQVGFWNRTYCSRPASNPAPSRANNGPHAGSGHGRSATPGRSPAGNGLVQPAWGYTGGAGFNQGPQLGELFTTQAIKVPQRFCKCIGRLP